MKKLLILAALVILLGSSALAQRIDWIRDYDLATRIAKEKGKPILLDFTASWCGPCRAMDKSFWPKPEVVELSKQFVCVKVDFDREKVLAAKYSVKAIPYIVFTDPWSRFLNFHKGYGGATDFEIGEKIRALPKDFTPLIASGKLLATDGKNLDALSQFAAFYQEQGLFWIAQDFQSQIVKLEKDPSKLENAMLNLAFNYIRLVEPGDAIVQFETLQQKFPTSPQSDFFLYGLFVANVRKNKPDIAAKYLSDLKIKYPTSQFIMLAENMIPKGSLLKK